MKKIAAGAIALSILVACTPTTPAAATTPGAAAAVPKATWEKVLREVALASLRAVVCTQPSPLTAPEVPAEVMPAPAPSP